MISTARHACARTAAVLLVLALVPGVSQARSETGDRSSIHIDNFAKVNSSYYRGAQPADADYPALAALGIKMVLDLRGTDGDAAEKALVEHSGMKYIRLPMTTHEAPTMASIELFLKTVTDPANLPVYVHCVGGRHRTGVMTAVYRMAQEGWSAAEAFKEMKQYKYGADFLHPEFKEFIFRYSPPVAAAATR